MKTYITVFLSGFAQVFLVSANIYFISKAAYIGIAVSGFGISYLWAINVGKIAISSPEAKAFYAVGATLGGLSGVFIAKLFNH